MGTLIGADLLDLREIPQLGAPVASIGGAGTLTRFFWAASLPCFSVTDLEQIHKWEEAL